MKLKKEFRPDFGTLILPPGPLLKDRDESNHSDASPKLVIDENNENET